MPSVKGSKQIRMKVVPHRPWRALLFRVTSVCIVFLLTGLAFGLGFYRGVNLNGDARMARQELEARTGNQTQQITELRERLLLAEQASEVDLGTLEEVRESLVSLRETIHEQEEELSFYRQVMAPEAIELGLVIGDLDIRPSENDAAAHHFRLELRQHGNNDKAVSGAASVAITGTQDGESRTLSLGTLRTDDSPDALPFRFRYFQNLEGEFTLPEGFSPEGFSIVVKAEGRETLEKNVPWRL